MEFETISYPITPSQRLLGETEQDKSKEKPFQITIKFSSNNADASASVVLSAHELKNLSNRFAYPFRKEKYYLVAINNLLKKSDFLQLSLQHAENGITDDEFENELEENSHKYLIDLNEIPEPSDINIIGEIVSKLDREFTVDEVSEMFSVTPSSLNNRLLDY